MTFGGDAASDGCWNADSSRDSGHAGAWRWVLVSLMSQ
jgi:hypothetical protein